MRTGCNLHERRREKMNAINFNAYWLKQWNSIFHQFCRSSSACLCKQIKFIWTVNERFRLLARIHILHPLAVWALDEKTKMEEREEKKNKFVCNHFCVWIMRLNCVGKKISQNTITMKSMCQKIPHKNSDKILKYFPFPSKIVQTLFRVAFFHIVKDLC